MDKDAHLHMRIPADIKAAATAAAADDNRTLSSWIETLIRRELERLSRPDVQHEREMLKRR